MGGDEIPSLTKTKTPAGPPAKTNATRGATEARNSPEYPGGLISSYLVLFHLMCDIYPLTEAPLEHRASSSSKDRRPDMRVPPGQFCWHRAAPEHPHECCPVGCKSRTKSCSGFHSKRSSSRESQQRPSGMLHGGVAGSPSRALGQIQKY